MCVVVGTAEFEKFAGGVADVIGDARQVADFQCPVEIGRCLVDFLRDRVGQRCGENVFCGLFVFAGIDVNDAHRGVFTKRCQDVFYF